MVIASKWQLDRDRLAQMLAVASGIDLSRPAKRPRRNPSSRPPSSRPTTRCSKPAPRRCGTWSSAKQALQDDLTQLRLAQEKTADEQRRYKQSKESFDAALRRSAKGPTANGTEEVRRILEAIKPKQAKDLLVQMLDEKKLDEVVVLLSAMPDAKRAKIIGEFKTAEDKQRIGEVLDRIGEGAPTAEIADETIKQLAPPKPAAPLGATVMPQINDKPASPRLWNPLLYDASVLAGQPAFGELFTAHLQQSQPAPRPISQRRRTTG